MRFGTLSADGAAGSESAMEMGNVHPSKVVTVLIGLALANASFGHLGLRWYHQASGVAVDATVVERHRVCALKGGRSVPCPMAGETAPKYLYSKYDVTLKLPTPDGEERQVRLPEGRVGRDLRAGQVVSVVYNAEQPQVIWSRIDGWISLMYVGLGLFGLMLLGYAFRSQRNPARPV